jgi:hypothetical protein
MASQADLIQRVGEDLGIVPIAQPLEAQDVTRIGATYTEVYDKLVEKGIATWAAAAAVPTELVPYFALLMEQKLLTSYSVPDSRYQRITQEAGPDGMTALRKLAELVVPEYEDNSDAGNY